MDFKKTIVILGMFLLVCLGISVTKDLILKNAVILVASQVTGAPVNMDSFSLGIFNQTVKISGFKLYNPPGFSHSKLIYLTKIKVQYDILSLLKGKLHLPYAEINLQEMGIEKNKNGKLNADSLKIAEKKKSDKPAKEMPLAIDMLRLDIGKVVLKDYSSGKKEPAISVYDVNIHKTYKNITSAQQLAALIIAEPMKAAGIQGAAIYGVAAIAGVAVLPVAVASTFAGKDSVEHNFSSSFDTVYDISVSVVRKMGRLVQENRQTGVITAEISSAKVTVQLSKMPAGNVRALISARKYMLPKPEIAGGLLYAILEKTK